MYKVITTAAADLAAAGTVIGAEISGLDVVDSLLIVATLTGITGGTLDVYLQVAPKEAAVWVDYLHPTQIAAGAAAITRTWSVSRHAQQLTATAVAVGDTPALAANSILGGDFGERMRLVYVVGAGASAGAVQTIRLIGSETKRRA